MNGRTLLALLGFTALLSMSMGYVGAQQLQGVESTELAVVDLGPHFECLEGMVLKMTYHKIGPQVSGGQHSHLGRPEVFYVLDGSIVEHQNGTSREYSAGEGFVSNADLTKEHRIENASDSVATVMDIQIVSADR